MLEPGWLGPACDRLREVGLDEAADFLSLATRVRFASRAGPGQEFTVVQYFADAGELVELHVIRGFQIIATEEPPDA
jgi:hypothetical protein